MSTKPNVSVVMAVLNGEKYLTKAIESILNQTFVNFEFIIVDDGSIDRTWEILQRYQDPRIHLVKNENNRGLIVSLNKGIELSRGKYIARMDADDVSLPERLAQQVEFMEANPEVGVLGGVAQKIDSNGKYLGRKRYPATHKVIKWLLCFSCPIIHPTVMMRREVIEQVGGYSEERSHAEDLDLWHRLSRITRLTALPDVLLYYRRHEASVSKVHASIQRQNALKVWRQMISDLLCEDIPLDVVQCLVSPKKRPPDDLRPLARLVYKMYKVTVSGGELSNREIRFIRRSAAMRMYYLSRPSVRNLNAWGELARAWYLDPLLVLRVVNRGLHHSK